MPQIPVSTTLGFIGILLLLVGGFLLLSGLGIIRVEKITVQKGKQTWVLGAVCAILGLLFIIFSEPIKSNINAIELTNTPTSTIVSVVAETPTPTTSTTVLEEMPLPLYEQAKEWTLEVYESFDRNDAGWTVGTNEQYTYTQEIKNGEYIWSYAPQGEGHWFYQLSPFFSYSDFFASVSTKRSGDPNNTTSYGLIFRRQGPNFYLYRIDDFSSFAVQFIENGNWIDVIGWTRTDAIQPGKFNEIAVIAIGSDFTFYINKIQVGSVTDTNAKEGNIGFVFSTNEVSEQVDFEFDDFEIRLKP